MENLKEYYDFLDLHINASPAEINSKIEEKHRQFSLLLQNAPNDYLKKIHQNNITKLAEIKSHLTKGYAYDNAENFIDKYSAEKQTLAWLIRHTENKHPISFPIYHGTNYLGRSSNKKFNEIIIDDDIYISRNHAVIIVENNIYKITDNGSKNGTFLNGNDVKITSALLKNSDTIQIGNTKLVLKIVSDKPIEKLVKEVDNSAYMSTIVIDIL